MAHFHSLCSLSFGCRFGYEPPECNVDEDGGVGGGGGGGCDYEEIEIEELRFDNNNCNNNNNGKPMCIECYEQRHSNVCEECQKPIGVNTKVCNLIQNFLFCFVF